MNDDVKEDQLPKTSDQNSIPQPVGPVGSAGSKEAGPLGAEAKDLITSSEKGPEVAPELSEMGVTTSPHPMDETIKIADVTPPPMIVPSTQTAIANAPMTETEAFAAERTPDKSSALAWLGGLVWRALKKLSIKKPETPVQNPV